MKHLPGPETGSAFVTGASAGIGRALALRLAAAGWTVVAAARNAAALAALATEAPAWRIRPWPLDVRDDAAVRRAVDEIEEAFGPITLAVLNAGTHKPVRAAALDPRDFRALIELNLMGTVNCLAALLPAMRTRKRGQIAITASLAGYRGLPTAGAYGMTKAGLINMAEALAPELAADGICLQIANPGFVATPLTARNPFAMPFLISAEAAAEAYYAGLRRGRFEIVFPRRFAWLMKIYRCLPYFLGRAIARRLLPKD